MDGTGTPSSAPRLVAEEGTSRKKAKAPKQDVPFTKWLGGSFVSVPLVLLHLIVGTVCWKHLLEDNPSYYDSWYFTVVTFTTVGYGDILPVSGSAKLFFMFWCVLSSCIQFTVVSRFLGTVLALAPEPQADLQRDHSGRPLTQAANKFFQIRPRVMAVLKWILVMTVLLIIGTYLIRESYEQVQDTPLSWVDCWYWSFTTLTTVGYGDFVPQHQKVLFSLFFLVNVTIFGFVLSEVSAIVVDLDRYHRLEKLFADGLTEGLMDTMDTNHDGAISKVEFVAYVLDHLGIADVEEINAICMMFEALDADGNGMLLMSDTKERMHAHNVMTANSNANADAYGPKPAHRWKLLKMANALAGSGTPRNAAQMSYNASETGDGFTEGVSAHAAEARAHQTRVESLGVNKSPPWWFVRQRGSAGRLRTVHTHEDEGGTMENEPLMR